MPKTCYNNLDISDVDKMAKPVFIAELQNKKNLKYIKSRLFIYKKKRF